MQLSSKTSDWIGISSAILCTIHCLVAPLFFGGMIHAHHSADTHWLLGHHWDYVFLAIGLFAVWFSARHAHSTILKVALWLTFGLLAGAILMEEFSGLLQGVIYFSSAALILAHLVNLRRSLKPALIRKA